ncbi:MAG: hypothetical protein HQK49_15545 [Oligoflexia bacterium]|nr:hypothetical protein [Oligoflexia bacterium]
MKSSIFIMVILFLVALNITGCSKIFGEKKATVIITIPKPFNKMAVTKGAIFDPFSKIITAKGTTTNAWGLADPTSIEEIECLAIVGSWSGSGSGSGRCLDANNAEVINANKVAGTVAFVAGSNATITMEVPVGVSRNFKVVGFKKSAAQTCPSIATLSQAERAALSAPYILGQATVDISTGDRSIPLTISLTGAQKFVTCDGALFAWSGYTASSATITAANFANGELTITGTNLDSVHTVKLQKVGTVTSSDLSVVSKSFTSLVLKASVGALSVIAGAAYNLIITNAYGAETFAVTVTVKSDINVITTSNYSVATTDHYKLFVASGDVTFTLPVASGVDPGFEIRIKRNENSNSSIVKIIESVAGIDGNTYPIYLATKNASVQLISNGSAWYSGLKSGVVVRGNSSLYTCNGHTNNTAINCYQNSKIRQNVLATHTDGHVLYWDGIAWMKMTDEKYLIHDAYNLVASNITKYFSASLNFAVNGVVNNSAGYNSSLTIFYSNNTSPLSLESLFGVRTHSGGADVDNYVNQYGRPDGACNVMGMRLPRRSETVAGGGSLATSSSSTFAWTATGNVSNYNQYYVFNDSALSNGLSNNYSAMAAGAVCIINASEVENGISF